jgi:hypothetical protein
MRIYKQPLMHFLLLGALIFIASFCLDQMRGGNAVNESGIVSRDSFIEFIQYRHRGLNRAAAESLIKGMSAVEKKTLLDRYIKEEVLYREAIKLGLNNKDYVIKQRLIQKMEYLLDNSEVAGQALSAEQVELYFNNNRQRYFSPASITFTHVFIDSARHTEKEADSLTQALKTRLNTEQVPFENASRYGERFVYFTNYIERDKDLVRSHFGEAFTDALFTKELPSDEWIGPITSQYGKHLVRIAMREAGSVPPLADVYSSVAQDLARSQAATQLDNTVQQLVESYAVDVAKLEAEL